MSISNTQKTVKDICRNTRRKFSTEEKIRFNSWSKTEDRSVDATGLWIQS